MKKPWNMRAEIYKTSFNLGNFRLYVSHIQLGLTDMLAETLRQVADQPKQFVNYRKEPM